MTNRRPIPIYPNLFAAVVKHNGIAESVVRTVFRDAMSESDENANVPVRSFFFKVTATTQTSTLSLHDALPISFRPSASSPWSVPGPSAITSPTRSEEHTSELQSPYEIVCRLLLEKKKSVTRMIRRVRAFEVRSRFTAVAIA